MQGDRFASSWHEAVAHAGFDIYEPDTDQDRWTAGYSSPSTHIAVWGLIAEHSVLVDTWANDPGLTDDILHDVAMGRLQLRHQAEHGLDTSPGPPPIEPDTRLVAVGADTYRCPGQHLIGVSDLWVGHINIGGNRVQISTTSADRELAVRICTDTRAIRRGPGPRWHRR